MFGSVGIIKVSFFKSNLQRSQEVNIFGYAMDNGSRELHTKRLPSFRIEDDPRFHGSLVIWHGNVERYFFNKTRGIGVYVGGLADSNENIAYFDKLQVDWINEQT